VLHLKELAIAKDVHGGRGTDRVADAEVATLAADSTFEQFLELVPDALVGVDRNGRIALVNGQAEALFGYTRGELLGKQVDVLVPRRRRDSHPMYRAAYFAEPRTRPPRAALMLAAVRKDGSEFPAEISVSSIETPKGVLATTAIRDITERADSERERTLLEQLHQARRLESIGQLAGGVAHDFNNVLGVIMNYANFVAEELEDGTQLHEDALEIGRAAERAAALTRQLLIFSHRGVVKPEILDLNQLIGELEKLLHGALGERVELETRLAEELEAIEADPGQIEQVLVNLAVNARDAMPDGGRLTIETANAELDEEYAYMHPNTEPGSYVRLTVSDTGMGMERKVVERAFEPFFTTKPQGDGTGLGLATVYGIVTHAGGRVDIYSEPDLGTTVKIHLPTSSARPAPSRRPARPSPAGRGEVMLVVEDETDVRRMAERILTKGGFAVITTSDGAEALAVCEQRDQPIDLLLTDVIMPGMLGVDLVDRIKSVRSGLSVIFMSGYSHDVLAPEALTGKDGADFIEKPFTAEELLAKVHDLLNAGNGDLHAAAGVATPVPEDVLTRRQLEVLGLIAKGVTNAGIADRLQIAESTVKSHVKSIMRKLGVKNRTEAGARYLTR